MDKTLKDQAFELEEAKALLNEIKLYNDRIQEVPSPDYRHDTENENQLRAELETYKRIIGDYHPAQDSPTYKELLEKYKNLEKTKEPDKDQIKQYKQKYERVIKSRDELEKELLLIKSQKNITKINVTDREYYSEKIQKKPATLVEKIAALTKKKPEKPVLTSEQKIHILINFLNQHAESFNDAQVAFIRDKVIAPKQLPPEYMARFLNSFCTVSKMERMLSLYCMDLDIPYTPPLHLQEINAPGASIQNKMDDDQSTTDSKVIQVDIHNNNSSQTERVISVIDKYLNRRR